MPVEANRSTPAAAKKRAAASEGHDMTLRRPASADRNPIVDRARPETIETGPRFADVAGTHAGHFVHGRGVAACAWKGQL
jgi:hypothetical protein